MSKMNHKLLLQFHCDQNIEDMPLKENGTKRYCGQCDRNIVDFRNHSMEEILQYKKSLKGEKYCGIFREDHIQKEIIIQPHFESRKTIFSNSLLVLATLSLLTSCQNNDSNKLSEENEEETEINESDKAGLDSLDKDSTKTNSLKCKLPEKEYPIPPGIDPPEPFVGIEMEPEPPSPPDLLDSTYSIPQDEIYFIVEKMPEFPGGEAKMMEYFRNNIKYPAFAKEENLEGTVYIRFVVNENGGIIDPVILKTPNKVFDEPSLSVIRRMPQWIPGENAGKKVKVYFTVPIRYRLDK